jgi:UDP-N-acetylmuramoyl-tripeptide--D-alanyl-D-alanine ligase
MMTTLTQAAAWLTQAGLEVRVVGDGQTAFERVCTDTRSVQSGDLFVALKGEKFDAHDFLAQAKGKGAAAALAERGLMEAQCCGLEVLDAKRALGLLAKAWRAQFSLPLIAVTGSNGKTTVTQMIASILRAHAGEAAFFTQGNLNNDIGVPLTLLRLNAAHRIGVVELGMNHPGEIALLAEMAQPTVALVNNAQREHLEFMHTVDAVARENGSVISALARSGVAIFPAHDTYTPVWRELAGERETATFSIAGAAGITWAAGTFGIKNGIDKASGEAAGAPQWQVQANTPQGPLEFTLAVAGQHNVQNALAACACALAAGVALPAIASGLSAFAPVSGRSRSLTLNCQGRSIGLIDDSYNANPDSMKAAIEMLAALPGPRLLVIGDMGEVGDQGPQFHQEAGELARSHGIEHLLALGEQSAQAARSFGLGAAHFTAAAELNAAALALLPTVANVLVKGSRFMKMERVVSALQNNNNIHTGGPDAH